MCHKVTSSQPFQSVLRGSHYSVALDLALNISSLCPWEEKKKKAAMSKRKERMSLNHPPPDVQRRWVCGAIVLSLCIIVKGTGNKSAVPQAMNVMISPAVHNAIFSMPQAPAGINLLKHYSLEEDVQELKSF